MKAKKIYEILETELNTNELLIDAAYSGSLENIKKALKNGANINYEKPDGKISKMGDALSVTLRRFHYNIANFLLENGARINVALDDAIMMENEETIKFLIDKGVNFNYEKASVMRTIARAACIGFDISKNSYSKIAKMLIDAGVDVHAENDIGLQIACNSDDYELIKTLLEAGADVHANDEKSLQNATESYNDNIVDLLIKYGAGQKPHYMNILKGISREESHKKFKDKFVVEYNIIRKQMKSYEFHTLLQSKTLFENEKFKIQFIEPDINTDFEYQFFIINKKSKKVDIEKSPQYSLNNNKLMMKYDDGIYNINLITGKTEWIEFK
jgi:ankyrin repeat protein